MPTYESNLRQMVARLREKKISPVLMTPVPLGRKLDYMAWSPYREHGPNCVMIHYVHSVRQVALEEGVPLVDSFAVWAERALMGTDIDTLMLDGCHPNPAGQAVIAEAMYPVLARLLRR